MAKWSKATAKYRDPSPFDYAQGQDDDLTNEMATQNGIMT
jgi:hypothetical protein